MLEDAHDLEVPRTRLPIVVMAAPTAVVNAVTPRKTAPLKAVGGVPEHAVPHTSRLARASRAFRRTHMWPRPDHDVERPAARNVTIRILPAHTSDAKDTGMRTMGGDPALAVADGNGAAAAPSISRRMARTAVDADEATASPTPSWQLRALARPGDRPVPHDAREAHARSGMRLGPPAPVLADVTVPQSAPVATMASGRLPGPARDATHEDATVRSQLHQDTNPEIF